MSRRVLSSKLKTCRDSRFVKPSSGDQGVLVPQPSYISNRSVFHRKNGAFLRNNSRVAMKISSPVCAIHVTSKGRLAVRSSCMPRKDKKLLRRAFGFRSFVWINILVHRGAWFIAIYRHRRQVCVKVSRGRVSDPHS
jgi:hypothetical protein